MFSSLEGSVIIGRSSKCPFTVPFEDLSREHCLLEIKGNNFYITDLESRNGITIDDIRIPPNTPVLITSSALIILSNLYTLKIHSTNLSLVTDSSIRKPSITMIPEIQGLEGTSEILILEDVKEVKKRNHLVKVISIQHQVTECQPVLKNALKMALGFIVAVSAILYHALGT